MWVPFWTLFKKEVIRFLKVWMHTVLAPVLTGGLYLFVFGEALSKHLPVYDLWTTHPLSSGLPLFLIPELRAVSGNLRQPEVKCFAYK